MTFGVLGDKLVFLEISYRNFPNDNSRQFYYGHERSYYSFPPFSRVLSNNKFRIGRKKVFFIAIIIQIICGLLIPLAPYWPAYALFRLVDSNLSIHFLWLQTRDRHISSRHFRDCSGDWNGTRRAQIQKTRLCHHWHILRIRTGPFILLDELSIRQIFSGNSGNRSHVHNGLSMASRRHCLACTALHQLLVVRFQRIAIFISSGIFKTIFSPFFNLILRQLQIL